MDSPKHGTNESLVFSMLEMESLMEYLGLSVCKLSDAPNECSLLLQHSFPLLFGTQYKLPLLLLFLLFWASTPLQTKVRPIAS